LRSGVLEEFPRGGRLESHETQVVARVGGRSLMSYGSTELEGGTLS